MITSLSGNNKSIPINDDMTINLSKFKISKNKNNQLYLRSTGDFIYIFGPMRLDIDLNLFLTEHNDKAIMLISACYVNCSKFNSKFDKMKKNSFNNIKINKVNINNSNDINSNIVEQLEQLNSLYKSGVLSKIQEFEKAKKKIQIEMKIFPAIDIKDKKCVRLIKGDFENKTEYEMSPLEQAEKI